MTGTAIKVTVTDPWTGDILGEQIVDNDYMLICAGNRYAAHTNVHKNGTHVVTIKVDDEPTSDDRNEGTG